MNTMEFGKRLRVARKNANMTQKEMKNRLNVTQGAVSHWEQGKNTPTIQTVFRIAEALNCSADYLLGRTDALSVSGSVSQSVVATAPVSNVRIGNADGDGREVAALKAEVARLSALVESQQRTIEALTRGRR